MKPRHYTAALALLAASTAAARQPLPALSAPARHRLDSLFHYLDTTGLYNGNILVAAGGKKQAAASIGYANAATGERLTEASTFELASVSKQFTATGILRLVQAGKLQLDQPLATLFPELPYPGVTIRHLLNHTAGLPDYMDLMEKHWDKSRIATNKDVIAMLAAQHPPAEFAPGTAWDYSNTGYALLASVLEKVSGKSYAAYMQEAVFAPLQLTHTTVYQRSYAPRRIEGYAYGYVRDEDGTYKLPDSIADYARVVYLDGIAGDGAVNSTTGDLLRWNNAVRDRKLLPAALWNEALTAPVIQGKSTDYGFGFIVAQNPERGRVLMHTGGWPGYQTRNVLYLDKDVSIILLANREQTSDLAGATWEAVKNIVFDKPAEFPKPLVQVVATVDKSVYPLYCGTFDIPEDPGFEITVRTDSGSLFIRATGQGELEVQPEGPGRFFVAGAPIGIEFESANGQPATALILNQNGRHVFRRKP